MSVEQGGPTPEEHAEAKLENAWRDMDEELQDLIPLDRFKTLQEQHFDEDKEGGSKFYSKEEGGADNLADLFENVDVDELMERVENKDDDREDLIEAGSDKGAFLPAEKSEGMPEGLPEALYYKVDGVKGEFNMERMSEFDDGTPVKIVREKEGAAPSIIVESDSEGEENKEADFGVVILGQDQNEEGELIDEKTLYTAFPGQVTDRFQELTIETDNIEIDTEEELDVGESLETTVGELKKAGVEDRYIKVNS